MELREARDPTGVEAETIRSLIKPYLAELRSLTGKGDVPPPEYPYLPLYWSEEGRHAFVVVDEAKIVGFVLIRAPDSTGTDAWEMAEFYIRPDARRRGLGMAAAQEIWCRNLGSWEIEVSAKNRGAIEFWSQAVRQALGSPPAPPVQPPKGVGRVVFRFTLPKPPN